MTTTRSPSWADLNECLLDLLCPLCSQVIHVGLRGSVLHDTACRSAPQIRALIDTADEDISTLSSYYWGPQHEVHVARNRLPSRTVQVTDQLRRLCLLGVPLSTTVRRPGAAWALLAPNEEVDGPSQSLAHWPSLIVARAGLVPPGRSALLRATVELSRVRYANLVSQTNDSLIHELRLNEDIVLSRINGMLTPPCSAPEEPPARWHAPGSLVTLQATNTRSLPATVDAVVLLSVHFAGYKAPP